VIVSKSVASVPVLAKVSHYTIYAPLNKAVPAVNSNAELPSQDTRDKVVHAAHVFTVLSK